MRLSEEEERHGGEGEDNVHARTVARGRGRGQCTGVTPEEVDDVMAAMSGRKRQSARKNGALRRKGSDTYDGSGGARVKEERLTTTPVGGAARACEGTGKGGEARSRQAVRGSDGVTRGGEGRGRKEGERGEGEGVLQLLRLKNETCSEGEERERERVRGQTADARDGGKAVREGEGHVRKRKGEEDGVGRQMEGRAGKQTHLRRSTEGERERGTDEREELDVMVFSQEEQLWWDDDVAHVLKEWAAGMGLLGAEVDEDQPAGSSACEGSVCDAWSPVCCSGPCSAASFTAMLASVLALEQGVLAPEKGEGQACKMRVPCCLVECEDDGEDNSGRAGDGKNGAVAVAVGTSGSVCSAPTSARMLMCGGEGRQAAEHFASELLAAVASLSVADISNHLTGRKDEPVRSACVVPNPTRGTRMAGRSEGRGMRDWRPWGWRLCSGLSCSCSCSC